MRKMEGISVCICACMPEVPLWGSGNIQYHRTISRCLCMCARRSTRAEVTVQKSWELFNCSSDFCMCSILIRRKNKMHA